MTTSTTTRTARKASAKAPSAAKAPAPTAATKAETPPKSALEVARTEAADAAANLQRLTVAVARAERTLAGLLDRASKGLEINQAAFGDAKNTVELQRLQLGAAEDRAARATAELARLSALDVSDRIASDPAFSGKSQAEAEGQALSLIERARKILVDDFTARSERLAIVLAGDDATCLPMAKYSFGYPPELANESAPVHRYRDGIVLGKRTVTPEVDPSASARKALTEMVEGTFKPTAWSAPETDDVDTRAAELARALFEKAATHAGSSGRFDAWSSSDWATEASESTITVQVLEAEVTESGIISAKVVGRQSGGANLRLPLVGSSTRPYNGAAPAVVELQGCDGFAVTESGGGQLVGWLPQAVTTPLTGKAAVDAVRSTLEELWSSLAWSYGDGRQADGGEIFVGGVELSAGKFQVHSTIRTEYERRGQFLDRPVPPAAALTTLTPLIGKLAVPGVGLLRSAVEANDKLVVTIN